MNRDINIKLVLKILGGLLLIEAIFLVFPLLVNFMYGESEAHYYLITIILAVFFGGLGMFIGRNAEPTIGKREGACIVTSTWILYTLIGSLPFYLSGEIPAFTDAFFETLSGFTTTGNSILDNVEALPYNLLFWRSLTHWIGGLGIVVFSLALLPMIGGSGYQLFTSESTTPTREKIHPKVSETAKILVLIYLILTVLCTLALFIAGMNFFDAMNHALSTISTGGFSTKQASIGYWNSPAIEYIIIVFMFFSGINFVLFYFLYKLDWRKIVKNEELKYYLLILVGALAIIVFANLDKNSAFTWGKFEETFRDSLFIVTSVITTTGLCTVDYTLWNQFTWIILLVLMVTGASSYSTAGGLKIARIVILSKFCYYEFKKMIHPNAVMPVRFNGQIIRDDLMMRVLAFTAIYCLIILVGTFILSFSGLGLQESVSGMITCMSDVGLGLGKLGPESSFAAIPVFSKWFLAFVMLVGRLEIYSVILLFTPAFWEK